MEYLNRIMQWRIVTLWSLLICVLTAPLAVANEETNQLKNIDFKADKERSGVILVELESPSAIVDIKRVQEGLSIELINTNVEESLLAVFDVKDFATVVDSVEVFREKENVRLVAFIDKKYEHTYNLNGRFLEVTLAAIKDEEKAKPKSLLEKEGKLMSINFQDIPVRNVLQLLADYNDFNLVVSDTVGGNLTLRLDGVPWQQVLDIILQVKGLDKRVEGTVVLIAPKEELDEREKQSLEQQKLEEELGVLESDILKVNFAKASDIADMITGDNNAGMLSERGSINIDDRTNSILVRDLPENIAVVREIVSALDVPVKQVQIEARIVTVSEGNLDELGVRWGFTSINGSHTVGGSIENNLATIGLYEAGGGGGSGSESGGGESGGEGEGGGSSTIADFLNVNLGATSAGASSIAFQVAKLGSDTLLDLELSALQRENKAEVVSSPRLITTNKQPAYIEQGTEIPYVEATSSGATSVSFKKAVLSLKVTPQITPDNRLVLDLNVTQDRVGDVVKTGTGEAVAINTQRIGTQVLVNNGETVVLGGIFQHSVTNTMDKVPLLGDIPYLGALFRRSYEQFGKSELLIFVTPKVVVQ